MNLKKQIIQGSFWVIIGQIGYMLISLLTNIVLARLLSAYEFGEMGILMFFVMIANILTEGGFGGALVRRKNVTSSAYSTVFIFSVILSVVCYIILAAFSGVIASFYNDSKLQTLICVLGFVFIINAFSISQNAKLIIDLKFKQRSIFLFIANCLASIICIIMALKGAGVWALITFQLLTSLFNTLLLIIYSEIRLSFKFDISTFRELFSFGVNTSLTSILGTIFDNIYQLILGRYFSLSQTGLFYQAKKLQLIPFTILNSVVQGVMYSSLSKLQAEKIQFMKLYNKLMLLFAILMVGITSFIYLYAGGIVSILFGKKWLGAAFFMQLLSISSFFYFQELINNLIFKIFNKTKQILYLEIVKKIIQTISIVIGIIFLSINVLLVGFVISSIISYGINFYFSRLILGKDSFYEIFSIIKLIIVSCISVFLCKLLIDYFFHLTDIEALFTIPFAFLVYSFLLKMFKVADLIQEIKLFKSILNINIK